MESSFLHNVSSWAPKHRPNSDYASSITVRSLPLIGRVHIVNDFNGLMQVSFVFAYWIYGTFSTLFIILIPHYNDGHLPYIIIVGYLFISIMCLLSLVKAAITNPGRIPLASQEPSSGASDWTFCNTCNRKRPPRAHHCRRCQQCVMRMDHHCPWINNCVGEENHYSFFLLLYYAFLLGSFTFLITMLHFWVWPECQACDHEVFYIKHSVWFVYVLVVLAINMALVMLCQLLNQHFNLLMDRTTIDNMLMQSSPTISAEDGPKLRKSYIAYRELCGRGSMPCWFWPCRRRFTALHSHTTSV